MMPGLRLSRRHAGDRRKMSLERFVCKVCIEFAIATSGNLQTKKVLFGGISHNAKLFYFYTAPSTSCIILGGRLHHPTAACGLFRWPQWLSTPVQSSFSILYKGFPKA